MTTVIPPPHPATVSPQISLRHSPPPAFFIGLMSGTSMDGIDGVLIDLAPAANFAIRSHRHQPFNPSLRESLFALNQPGEDELHRSALAANAIAIAYAGVVAALLEHAGITAADVHAIGAHGQTVRHRPGEFDGTGYTCQLLNGALLAERTGINVVCDFRSRDVAAGGQGAPLVPAFHKAAFDEAGRNLAILNIGGIANLTLLHADGSVKGFDCGPGNVLLDLWCNQHTGQAFDNDGNWAKTGDQDPALLQEMLQDPYLNRAPPKSTGRDDFNAKWLQKHTPATTAAGQDPLRPQDVQATLCELTAQAAANAIKQWLPNAQALLVCGGGALNSHLMGCLARALPNTEVKSIADTRSIDPMHVEAAAFAWLAKAQIEGLAGNMPAVTGAQGPRPLGAMYRA